MLKAIPMKCWTVVLLLALAFLAANCTEAETWPGWRGGELQGRSEGKGNCVSWDQQKNVIWKTALPGDGFSSPAVSEDAVYVTAVTKEEKRHFLILGVEVVGYLLFLTFILTGLNFLIRSHATASAPQLRLAALFGVIGCSVLFGDRLLNFDAYSGSARLVVAAAASAPCLVCGLAFWPGGTSRRRNLILCLSLLLLAGGSSALLAGSSVWRESLWRLPLALILITGTLAAALFYAARVLQSYGAEKGLGAGGAQAASPKRWLSVCLVVARLLSVGFAVLACVLAIRMLAKDAVADQLAFDTYKPRIPIWVIVGLTLPGLAVLVIQKRRGIAPVSELIVLLTAMATGPVVLAGLVERGLVHLAYLRHILLSREPVLEPIFGWWSVIIAVGCFATGLVFVCLIRARTPEVVVRGKLFRVVSVVLGVWLLASRSGLLQSPQGPGESLSVVAVNRGSGKLSWVRRVADAPTEYDRLNSRATSTPALWRDRIYSYFGSPGLACVDRRGKLIWQRADLPFESHYGVVVSPVIAEDLVILVSESSMSSSNKAQTSFIAALDCETGELRWKMPRPRAKNYGGNNRTPILLPNPKGKLVVAWGGDDVTAYESFTGAVKWTYQVPRARSRWDLVASPIADEKRLYLPQHGELIALEIANLGTEREPLLWRRQLPFLDCASPVVANGLLFAVTDRGAAYCLDANTGDVLWQRPLEGTHYSSPVVLGDFVYFCSLEGRTTVVACERVCRVVAENDLNERTIASFAAADRRLFVRTQMNLFCIGSTEQSDGRMVDGRAPPVGFW